MKAQAQAVALKNFYFTPQLHPVGRRTNAAVQADFIALRPEKFQSPPQRRRNTVISVRRAVGPRSGLGEDKKRGLGAVFGGGHCFQVIPGVGPGKVPPEQLPEFQELALLQSGFGRSFPGAAQVVDVVGDEGGERCALAPDSRPQGSAREVLNCGFKHVKVVINHW